MAQVTVEISLFVNEREGLCMTVYANGIVEILEQPHVSICFSHAMCTLVL